MVARSRNIWIVAYFLSKYGDKINDRRSDPPVELRTEKWIEAYRMFYELLGDGRTINSFEHSLKNARDAFDSHLEDSIRVGWLSEDGYPNSLNSVAADVMNSYNKLDRKAVWRVVKQFSDLDLPTYKSEVNDLAASQNMEQEVESQSRTEGGAKVTISVRYERSLALRNKAFSIHGYSCAVCNFNFQERYGDWGKDFGEVHHLLPLSSNNGKKAKVNPYTDLIILCSNCHRMVHRKKGITLTVEELRNKIT